MPQSSSDSPAHRGGGSIFIGLVPWFLFTIIAERDTLIAGSIAALVIAIGVCLYGMRNGGRPKMIELAAVFSFAAFTVVAIIADPSLSHWLTRYARAIAAALLAALVFGSLLFTPFTEPYARERVSERLWSSPQFIASNRRLTLLWAGVFTIMTCSHVVAGVLDTRITNIVFNWVIPIWLIVQGVQRSTPPEDTRAAGQAA